MSKRRRSSVFKNKNEDCYLEKLDEYIQQYSSFVKEKIETLELNTSVLVKSPDDGFETLKKPDCQLPDIDNYVETMKDFLNKASLVEQERSQIKSKLEKLGAQLL